MKRAMKYFGHFLCTLALIVCFAQPVSAADETNYFDCTVFLYGFDSAVENITASSSAIQVKAGDGSGDTWVVASYGVTNGSTYYLATDPYDNSVGSVAELIMGDAESGVAVFRLDSPLTSRTAPALRTLDGLNEGDGAVVAGVADDSDGMFLFSRGVVLQRLAEQSGYTRLQLGDGSYPLSELDILPIGAVMSDVDEVIGFYLDGYQALPAGYIMSDADGIGSLGNSDPEPSSPEPADPEPETGGEEPAYTLESIQTNTGTQALLEQARAQQGQARTLQIVLIAVAGIVAAGIIAFAIVRSRKKAGFQASTSQTADTGGNPVPDFGKTEYVGGEEYGETQPVKAQYRVVPLPGTPGNPQEIPLQGLTFGRIPECDVVFPPDTPGVSGKHCSLRWRGGSLFLTDLGSSFGTLLEDGRKLSNESADLKPGMRFYLGSNKFGFQLEEL